MTTEPKKAYKLVNNQRDTKQNPLSQKKMEVTVTGSSYMQTQAKKILRSITTYFETSGTHAME